MERPIVLERNPEQELQLNCGSTAHAGGASLPGILLNAAATVHVVWFYLALVPSYLRLDAYETGRAATPFQYRLLMMLPLRFAHRSHFCVAFAHRLSAMHAWFPLGVRPESLVEAPIDLLAVAAAGLVARAIYRAASDTGLLTPFVYPLTLILVLATYGLATMHRLRFIYDLPSLGFFSIGLYLIYFRRSRLLFALLFLLATLNRETSLILLVFYGSAALPRLDKRLAILRWRLAGKDGLLLCALALAWAAWHAWIAGYYSANASGSAPRFWLNLGILLCPPAWIQLLSCFAFCGPLILLRRSRIRDEVLRVWLWILPLWVGFMLYYGLILEVRIFGELIPYIACLAALIAERELLESRSFISR